MSKISANDEVHCIYFVMHIIAKHMDKKIMLERKEV